MHRTSSTAISLIAGLVFGSPAVHALTQDLYTEQILRHTPVIRVYAGHSVSVSWIETGEVIKQAWLDDPSRFVLNFDGAMCQGPSHCGRNSGATVMQIKRIKPIQFQNILSSPSGETTLTVLTEGAGGKRKRYQFTLVPANGRPDVTAFDIHAGAAPISALPALPPLKLQVIAKPVSNLQPPIVLPPPPKPLINLTALDLTLADNLLNPSRRWTLNVRQPPEKTMHCPTAQAIITPTPQPTVSTPQTVPTPVLAPIAAIAPAIAPVHDQSLLPKPLIKSPANALQMGLLLATDPKTKPKPISIGYYSQTYFQVNSAIILLRERKSLAYAAQKAKLPLNLLKQLILMGGGQV